MATRMARTIAVASTPRRFCCALAPIGALPLRPRLALSPLAHCGVIMATRSASASERHQASRPQEAPQRSRSLHRRGGVASASPSSSSETENKKPRRRSRSRSRKRLLPSLEDLRPQPGEDDDGSSSSRESSLVSAAAVTTASSFPSSSSNSNDSVLSAVALIVGSSVGAGVLALPAVSAPAGFAPSATALVGVWALLTAEALLIAEVNLALLSAKKKIKRDNNDDKEEEKNEEEDAIVTLREMAHETLGARGGHFVAAAYLALSYSLMVAYISKAGELVSSALDPLLLSSSSAATALIESTAVASATSVISPGAGAALFTAAMGLTLFGGTAAVDGANKAMTASLLAAYAVIVSVGGAQADWGALAERAPEWSAAPAAIPVILLSLVYHDLVPVVCAQLRGDAAKVRTALFVGSTAPLAMFVLVRKEFF